MKKFAMAVALLLLLSPAAWAGANVGASMGQSDASADGAFCEAGRSVHHLDAAMSKRVCFGCRP